MIKTSNKAVLGSNFQISSYVSSCQKITGFFSVKREMPIFFLVNCVRANLFSVKRELDPTF